MEIQGNPGGELRCLVAKWCVCRLGDWWVECVEFFMGAGEGGFLVLM